MQCSVDAVEIYAASVYMFLAFWNHSWHSISWGFFTSKGHSVFSSNSLAFSPRKILYCIKEDKFKVTHGRQALEAVGKRASRQMVWLHHSALQIYLRTSLHSSAILKCEMGLHRVSAAAIPQTWRYGRGKSHIRIFLAYSRCSDQQFDTVDLFTNTGRNNVHKAKPNKDSSPSKMLLGQTGGLWYGEARLDYFAFIITIISEHQSEFSDL